MTTSDSADWQAIVEAHGERVFRIALRIVGSVHDAEDVAQQVFLEAPRLQANGAVRSWPALLVRLATRRAIDRLRRSHPTEELNGIEPSALPGPFEEAVANELAEGLRAAIARLPDQQAAVFALACFEQLSRDEIAAHLGISNESVSTALYKARQRLLKELSLSKGEIR